MDCQEPDGGKRPSSTEAMDLSYKPPVLHNGSSKGRRKGVSAFNVNNGATTSGSSNSRDGSIKSRSKHKNINIFKKHKLKYRYLLNRNRSTNGNSDSGAFGSSSMQGSSSTGSLEKNSTGEINTSTASPCTSSSSPSSGESGHSPQNFTTHEDIQPRDQQMCMMVGQAVPLIVMMQGQLQSTNSRSSDISYSNTMLFKCNMCNMFSNNLTDVLNHVNSNHADIHYCFVCSQFHNSKSEFDRHKDVCETARQAFHQIIDGHYQGGGQANRDRRNNSREQALNLTTAGNVAMRAAQMVHSKKSKGRQNQIKNLHKCTYCKKAFFGRFYLQRHMRSHTGEKPCHCSICGKGFAEWRNLRNHMARFHNGSESISSASRKSKSVSPNITSESDQASRHQKSALMSRSSEQINNRSSEPSTVPTIASQTMETFPEPRSKHLTLQKGSGDSIAHTWNSPPVEPPPMQSEAALSQSIREWTSSTSAQPAQASHRTSSSSEASAPSSEATFQGYNYNTWTSSASSKSSGSRTTPSYLYTQSSSAGGKSAFSTYSNAFNNASNTSKSAPALNCSHLCKLSYLVKSDARTAILGNACRVRYYDTILWFSC